MAWRSHGMMTTMTMMLHALPALADAGQAFAPGPVQAPEATRILEAEGVSAAHAVAQRLPALPEISERALCALGRVRGNGIPAANGSSRMGEPSGRQHQYRNASPG